ncbi:MULTISPECIES: hypothetical protein [Spirulina sp. CCY15215]|uniref:hypothetical protein n=1 Tax=Spirulina sp. CCY15215 TaxID=2767591 RepID=UPI001EF25841|nr:hypothetical protein [Spirulina major]
MKRSKKSRFLWSFLLANLSLWGFSLLFVKTVSSQEIQSSLSEITLEIAQIIFFGEDSIELREQYQRIEQPPQQSPPETETPTEQDSPDRPTDSETPTPNPQPVGDTDSENTDSEDTDSENTDSEDTDSENTDSENTDSENTDSENTDSENTDSENTDSENTDSENTDSENTDSENTDSENTDSEDNSRGEVEEEGFKRYFLADALNGVADPFSGRGSSAVRIQALEGQILNFIALNRASGVGGTETLEGTFSLNIAPGLQTAIDDGSFVNFLGSGGSIRLTGNNGTIADISVNRTSFNSATISIAGTTIGITVNNFTGQGASISGDPLTGLAQLNAGTAGRITLNGQPATIRAGLTGNDGVIQFVGANGETFQIRVNNVTGVTQEQLDNLTLDSTTFGGITFGSIPDR